jgi:hypothetical protein
MKTKIAILSLTVVAAYSGFSQGEVEFNNSSQTKISVNTAGAPTTFTAIAGTGYYFALFDSAGTTSQTVLGGTAAIPGGTTLGYVTGDSNWTYAGLGQSTTAGKFAATTVDANGFTQLPLSGGVEPSAAQYVVIGWSSNIGSTIQSLESFFAGSDGGVTSGFVGESVVSGSLNTGSSAVGSLSSPSSMFSGAAPFIPGFDLGNTTVTTPEPTTIALGVMGAASLLAFRRKKA